MRLAAIYATGTRLTHFMLELWLHALPPPFGWEARAWPRAAASLQVCVRWLRLLAIVAVGLAWLAGALALGWHLIGWWADLAQLPRSTTGIAPPSHEFIRWLGR